jgi:mannose-6-phosphate isomerase-like protein (cupin superfamily)
LGVIDNPHGLEAGAAGALGPLPLLSAGECALLARHHAFGKRAEPAMWGKGHAVTDRLLFDVATSPPLLAPLRPLLGPDIILWGARFVRRKPGQAHAWHVDIEAAASGRRFASVWIGLRNTSRESGPAFIPGSHRFPRTVLELQEAEGVGRDDADDATVLAWARRFDPRAEIVQPEIADGEGLVFDGRLWHGTLNRRESGARLALLLQYAEADAPVFMPDPALAGFPQRLVAEPRPPVILVCGEGNGGGNRQVAPPPAGRRLPPLGTAVRPVALPLERDPQAGWRPTGLLRGPTPILPELGCHVSVLEPGAVPHAPHAHVEEEILLVLDGRAELLIGDGPDLAAAEGHPVGPGMFAYYPAYRHHTLRNTGSGPLTYLMFKWRGAPRPVEAPLALAIVDSADRPAKPEKERQTWLLLEGPTSFLAKLHVHLSDVVPGGGYEPHADPYDVAIVVLEGTIETVGRTVGPFGVVFTPQGAPHGLRNVGAGPARYLVFEFHGEAVPRPVRKAKPAKPPRVERRKSLFVRLRRRLVAALGGG